MLLAVAAAVALAEAGMARLQGRLSADVRNLLDAPGVVRELAAAPAPRVLFLGNSMIRRGIAADVGEQLTATRGAPCATARVFLDGSDALEWRWALERWVVEPGARPDVLVLGFTPGQLGDDDPVRPQRLAWQVRLGEVPRLAREESLALDPAVHLALARTSSLVRNADRVRQRTLDVVVPGYRQLVPRLGAGPAPPRMRGGDRRLRRLLELLARERIHVVALAMPTREDYPLPPQLLAELAAGGATLVDGRHPPGLARDASWFLDDLHLNEEGARRFTPWVVTQLAPLLSR